MLKWLRIVFLAWPRVLYDYLFHILPYSRHPERYPIEVRFHHIAELVRFLFKLFRLDIKRIGHDEYRALELEGKGILLAPNHIADFDPLLLIALSSRPLRPVAKIETSRYPVIGRAIKALDGLFMDRGDLRQSLGVIQAVSKGLKEGRNYVIFPEGTRNKDREHLDALPFHPGTFKAATRSGAFVVPCSLYGTFRILAFNRDYRRLPIEVKYFPSFVASGLSTEEIAERAEKEVASGVALFKKEDVSFFEKGLDKLAMRRGNVRS